MCCGCVYYGVEVYKTDRFITVYSITYIYRGVNMPRTIQVNKTTGFKPDVLNKIVERCESENREWNDVIDEVLRAGLGMDGGK